MEKPRGVIVGAGHAGTNLHFGALTVNGAEIVAFVDSNLEGAQAQAKRLRVPNAYATLTEALEKEKPDFVSVCTPVGLHLPLAKEALEAGATVLLEKPMTATVAEADELAAVIKKTGKQVCVVHNHKFYPGVQEAIQMVNSGQLGELTHVHREMSFVHSQVRMMEPEHWAHKIPGGRLFEANPHNLYLLHNFMGEFELTSMQARKVSDRWPHAKIDEFLATGKNEKTTMSLHASMHHEDTEQFGDRGPVFFVLIGTKGTAVGTYHATELLQRSAKDVLRDAVVKKLNKWRDPTFPKIRDSNGAPVSIGVGSGHYYYMQSFVRFLRGHAEIPVTWQEAYFTEAMNEQMGEAIDALVNKSK